jgi:hypothetical protein
MWSSFLPSFLPSETIMHILILRNPEVAAEYKNTIFVKRYTKLRRESDCRFENLSENNNDTQIPYSGKG